MLFGPSFAIDYIAVRTQFEVDEPRHVRVVVIRKFLGAPNRIFTVHWIGYWRSKMIARSERMPLAAPNTGDIIDVSTPQAAKPNA